MYFSHAENHAVKETLRHYYDFYGHIRRAFQGLVNLIFHYNKEAWGGAGTVFPSLKFAEAFYPPDKVSLAPNTGSASATTKVLPPIYMIPPSGPHPSKAAITASATCGTTRTEYNPDETRPE